MFLESTVPKSHRPRRRLRGALATVSVTLVALASFAAAPGATAQESQGISTVTGQGAGSLGLGTDLATLQSQLPDGWTVGPRVEIPLGTQTVFGHVIRDGDDVALLTATTFEQGDRLHLFLIGSNRWATPEGVSVGQTVADVAATYGVARTGAAIDSDRVFVTFDDNPDRRMRFVVGTNGRLGERTIESIRLQCIPGVTCPGDPGQSTPTDRLSQNPIPAPTTTGSSTAEQSASTHSTDDAGALAATGVEFVPHVLIAGGLVASGLGFVRLSARRTRPVDWRGPRWTPQELSAG